MSVMSFGKVWKKKVVKLVEMLTNQGVGRSVVEVKA